jgi:hypothetical protein
VTAIPTRKRGKQATSYQRDYLVRLIEQKPEYSSRHVREGLRVLLYRVCPAPALSFRVGDDIESALYLLDTFEASQLIKLLGGTDNA